MVTTTRLLPARIRVPSSSGTTRYIVVVNLSGAITCNCPAGWHHRDCRHARAVAAMANRRRKDPVTPALYLAVMERDDGCVAAGLGADPNDCRWPLQLDHVKDQPRMGKRAPSDERHLVSVCAYHHLEGWATSHRPELRAYLARVTV